MALICTQMTFWCVMMSIYSRYMHTKATITRIYDTTMSQWLSYALRWRSEVSWCPYIAVICIHMLLLVVCMIQLCHNEYHMHSDDVLMCHDVHKQQLYASICYNGEYLWYTYVTVTLICAQMMFWCPYVAVIFIHRLPWTCMYGLLMWLPLSRPS